MKIAYQGIAGSYSESCAKEKYSEDIVDFIIATVKSENKIYNFSQTKFIEPNMGDSISYLIPDRGFYKNIISKIENDNYYLENVLDRIKSLKRMDFKVSNLPKFSFKFN